MTTSKEPPARVRKLSLEQMGKLHDMEGDEEFRQALYQLHLDLDDAAAESKGDLGKLVAWLRHQLDVMIEYEYGAGEYAPQEIRCDKGPIVRFDGRVLAEHTTNPKGNRDRWVELRVWATPAGAWIVETVSCSDKQEEQDFANALVLDHVSDLKDPRSRPIRAMDWMGWSNPARALASKLDWDLTVEVS